MPFKLWSHYLLDCLLIDICVGVSFLVVGLITTIFVIKK